MSNAEQAGSGSSCRIRTLSLLFIVGLVLGGAAVGALTYAKMPDLMINVRESKYATVDETCAELVKAIESHGWVSPGVRDMNKSMAKNGVTFGRPVRIVELCKASHAEGVLTTNPELLTLMPCALGVYQGKDGKVYISGLNSGLLGTMFGGNVAEIMGEQVSHDVEVILADVCRT